MPTDTKVKMPTKGELLTIERFSDGAYYAADDAERATCDALVVAGWLRVESAPGDTQPAYTATDAAIAAIAISHMKHGSADNA